MIAGDGSAVWVLYVVPVARATRSFVSIQTAALLEAWISGTLEAVMISEIKESR